MAAIGIIGFGIVGKAIHAFYINNIKLNRSTIHIYDKYISEYNILSEDLLASDIIYVCIPTPNIESGIDLSALDEVLELLNETRYQGHIIIKSTIIPGTMDNYAHNYKIISLK